MVLIASATVASSGNDWNAVIAVAESIQVLVLVAAGWIALQQVRQARLSRLAQYRAFVIIYARTLETENSLIEIVIENIGVIPAQNVIFTFSPDLETTMTQNQDPESIMPWSALESGVAYLAPGQKITHLFDSLIQRYGSTLPNVYEVNIDYESAEGKKSRGHSESYNLDLSAWYGTNFVTIYGIHNVAKSLQEITRQLKDWTESGSIRVLGSDLEKDRADRANRRQSFIANQDTQASNPEVELG
jgi:hypothetical protein